MCGTVCPDQFSCGLYAQSRSKQSKVVSRAEIVASKLTREQKRGLRLLKPAEEESAGLQPDTRTGGDAIRSGQLRGVAAGRA